MYNFEFEQPGSVADAVAALGAEDAQALGGGQTLIPTLKQRLNQPSKLVSLSGIADIKGVCKTDDGALSVGGATTHATVAAEAAADYPGLAGLASHIGDPAVRNRGTIGGSLANNDPGSRPTAARSRRMTISKACSIRRWKKVRSSPKSASRSPKRRTIRNSCSPPRVSRWSVSMSRNSPMVCGWL